MNRKPGYNFSVCRYVDSWMLVLCSQSKPLVDMWGRDERGRPAKHEVKTLEEMEEAIRAFDDAVMADDSVLDDWEQDVRAAEKRRRRGVKVYKTVPEKQRRKVLCRG